VTTVSVTVAAIYYTMTLKTTQRNMKNTLETRQAQLFMNIYKATYSKEWCDANGTVFRTEFKNHADWVNMRGDDQKTRAFSIIADWLEGIGVLVREKLVDIRLVSELNSGFIKWWWETYRQGIMDVREKSSFPRFMIEAEYLYNRVMDYAVAHPELRIATPQNWALGADKLEYPEANA